MERILVTNSDENLAPNFPMYEFYNPSLGGFGEFSMAACLPKAAQVLRDYYSEKYNQPVQWLITSVYRPNAGFGEHVTGDAFDSVPYRIDLRNEIINDIRNECKNWKTSVLIKRILETGVTVVIIENVCLHLAWRETNLSTHIDYVPSKFYIGEWQPSPTNPYGINTAYS